MKELNYKKIMLKILPVILISLVLITSYSNIFANSTVDNVMNKASGASVSDIDTAVGKVWGTILSILQIAAVAAIVIAGVRYMFASADQKADIKKGLGVLVLGAILVFAASTVVQFIISATNTVISK